MKQIFLIILALSIAPRLSAQETIGAGNPSPAPQKTDLLSVGITVGPTVGTGIHSIPHLLREYNQSSTQGIKAGICCTYETHYASRTDFAAEWSLTYGYHYITLHSSNDDGSSFDWNFPTHTLSARVAPKLVIHTHGPLSLNAGTGLGFSTTNLRYISNKDLYQLYRTVFASYQIDLNLGVSYPLSDRLTLAAELIYVFLSYETSYSELPAFVDNFNCQLLLSFRYTFKCPPVK